MHKTCVSFREHPTMGTIEIQPDALEDLEVKLTQALDAVKAAKGQRIHFSYFGLQN